ncbi:hypothetical protein AB4Z51_34555 [Bradyrhizobium sp. 2TAF36]
MNKSFAIGSLLAATVATTAVRGDDRADRGTGGKLDRDELL